MQVVSGKMAIHFRVLVVDDDDRILNFLRAKLKAAGYDILVARNGAEAPEYIQLKPGYILDRPLQE